MTSIRKVSNVRCPDIIEIENDLDYNDNETPTFTPRNELAHDDTTSSIVSDSTEGSSVHVDRNNLQQQGLPNNNNIHIKKSSDILIGSNTHFHQSVVIENYIAGNEGHATLEDPTPSRSAVTEQKPDSNWFCSLRTYIPCKSKWIFISLVLICVLSALCGLAVAAYFLYFHFAVYSVAGALFVCKTNDSAVCYIGSSTRSCSNIVSADGRAYISGHTTASICKIYSNKSCQGHIQLIETEHVPFFFGAESARC